MTTKRTLAGMAALALALPLTVQAAATIVIQNNDGAGEGFNDPTAAAPVGGNPGTTLGQQRLNVFQAAANIWGAQLNSIPTIVVRANFDPLSCTATGAVLGSAGPVSVFGSSTPGTFPFTNTWYHAALTNKLINADADPGNPEIGARFNSNLGQPGCLTGSFFYLGLDNNTPPGQINLITVVLHELGHGLGFSTVTSGTTGAFLQGFPSAYDHFLFDTTQNKTWIQMTDAERVASAVNARRLVWNGPNVTTAVPSVLTAGTPQMLVSAPGSVAGDYIVGGAQFGPPLSAAGVTGDIMPVSSPAAGAACNPLVGADAVAVNGNIALIDRGVCGFTIKVKNAQNAGAKAVIIADNVAGSPPPALGGSDPTITIPSVRITLADATNLKQALKFRSRTKSGVITTLSTNPLIRQGADALDRAMLYTPNPFQGGSSVSHYDTSAFRNLLMEPSINGDLTQSVRPPEDLTLPLLLDIGW